MAAGETIAVEGAARVAGPMADSIPAMPGGWRLVMDRSGAVFQGATVTTFGKEGLGRGEGLPQALVADLSHFGLIAVEGPDAQKFLASLFTGDVRLVSPTQGQFTSWCDGKGRMLSTFWLFMRGETYYLLLPLDLLASTLSRLRQFLLRSKATISDGSSDLVRLGLAGSGMAAQLTEALAGEVPAQRGETRSFGDLTLIAIGANPQPRWLAFGPVGSMEGLWEKLTPGTQAVGAGVWSLLDILAGIPLLVQETSGEFIPQMLNLEALGGLCFTKGCYPGQEVVARLQYRGQVKRRLYLAYITGEEIPPAGAKLYGNGTSESVGMVVAAAPAGPGKTALQAVVVIEHLASGDIHLHDLHGPRLEFREYEATVPA